MAATTVTISDNGCEAVVTVTGLDASQLTASVGDEVSITFACVSEGYTPGTTTPTTHARTGIRSRIKAVSGETVTLELGSKIHTDDTSVTVTAAENVLTDGSVGNDALSTASATNNSTLPYATPTIHVWSRTAFSNVPNTDATVTVEAMAVGGAYPGLTNDTYGISCIVLSLTDGTSTETVTLTQHEWIEWTGRGPHSGYGAFKADVDLSAMDGWVVCSATAYSVVGNATSLAVLSDSAKPAWYVRDAATTDARTTMYVDSSIVYPCTADVSAIPPRLYMKSADGAELMSLGVTDSDTDALWLEFLDDVGGDLLAGDTLTAYIDNDFQRQAYSIALDAATDFSPWSFVKGSTSGAIGKVFGWNNDNTRLVYGAISGTFQSGETITEYSEYDSSGGDVVALRSDDPDITATTTGSPAAITCTGDGTGFSWSAPNLGATGSLADPCRNLQLGLDRLHHAQGDDASGGEIQIIRGAVRQGPYTTSWQGDTTRGYATVTRYASSDRMTAFLLGAASSESPPYGANHDYGTEGLRTHGIRYRGLDIVVRPLSGAGSGTSQSASLLSSSNPEPGAGFLPGLTDSLIVLDGCDVYGEGVDVSGPSSIIDGVGLVFDCLSQNNNPGLSGTWAIGVELDRVGGDSFTVSASDDRLRLNCLSVPRRGDGTHPGIMQLLNGANNTLMMACVSKNERNSQAHGPTFHGKDTDTWEIGPCAVVQSMQFGQPNEDGFPPNLASQEMGGTEIIGGFYFYSNVQGGRREFDASRDTGTGIYVPNHFEIGNIYRDRLIADVHQGTPRLWTSDVGYNWIGDSADGATTDSFVGLTDTVEGDSSFGTYQALFDDFAAADGVLADDAVVPTIPTGLRLSRYDAAGSLVPDDGTSVAGAVQLASEGGDEGGDESASGGGSGVPLIETGTYTGSRPSNDPNSAVFETRRIKTRFRPDVMIVVPEGAYPVAWRGDIEWHGKTQFLADIGSSYQIGPYLGSIENPFSGSGFQVEGGLNVPGQKYHYIAIKNNGGNFVAGTSWIGNEQNGREIDFTTFLPVFGWVKRDNPLSGLFRATGTGTIWGEYQAGSATRISALRSTGYTLTQHDEVAQNDPPARGEGINGYAFNGQTYGGEARCIPFQYTGTGAAGRVLDIGHERKMKFAFLFDEVNDASGTTQRQCIVTDTMDAGDSKPLDGTAMQSGLVASLDNAGTLTLGTNAYNATGRDYTVVGFLGDQNAAVVPDTLTTTGRRALLLERGAGQVQGPNISIGEEACTVEWSGRIRVPDDDDGQLDCIELISVGGGAAVTDTSTGTKGYGAKLYAQRISKDNNGWLRWVIRWSHDGFYAPDRTGAVNDINLYNLNSGIVLREGVDYHILLTHDGSGHWRLYVNGKMVKDYQLSPSIISASWGARTMGGSGVSAPTWVGGRSDGAEPPTITDQAPLLVYHAGIVKSELTPTECFERFEHRMRGGAWTGAAFDIDADFTRGVTPSGWTVSNASYVTRRRKPDIPERDRFINALFMGTLNTTTETFTDLIPADASRDVVIAVSLFDDGTIVGTPTSITATGATFELLASDSATGGSSGNRFWRTAWYRGTLPAGAVSPAVVIPANATAMHAVAWDAEGLDFSNVASSIGAASGANATADFTDDIGDRHVFYAGGQTGGDQSARMWARDNALPDYRWSVGSTADFVGGQGYTTTGPLNRIRVRQVDAESVVGINADSSSLSALAIGDPELRDVNDSDGSLRVRATPGAFLLSRRNRRTLI